MLVVPHDESLRKIQETSLRLRGPTKVVVTRRQGPYVVEVRLLLTHQGVSLSHTPHQSDDITSQLGLWCVGR